MMTIVLFENVHTLILIASLIFGIYYLAEFVVKKSRYWYYYIKEIKKIIKED